MYEDIANKIPDWNSLDLLQRSVALFAFNCGERIQYFQIPAMALHNPPALVDNSKPGQFRRDLAFPWRRPFPPEDMGLDGITFILTQDPEHASVGHLDAYFFNGDADDWDFGKADGSFSCDLNHGMLVFKPDVGQHIPSHRMFSNVGVTEDAPIMIDAEDWFDACLYMAAAKPLFMPRPRVLDRLTPLLETAEASPT